METIHRKTQVSMGRRCQEWYCWEGQDSIRVVAPYKKKNKKKEKKKKKKKKGKKKQEKEEKTEKEEKEKEEDEKEEKKKKVHGLKAPRISSSVYEASALCKCI